MDKTAAPFKPKAKKLRGSAALDRFFVKTKMQLDSKVQQNHAKMKSGESNSTVFVPGRWS